LKIKPDFQPAIAAKNKLNQSKKIDWMSSWGLDEKARKTVGLILIGLTLAEIVGIFYLIFAGKYVSSNGLFALYAALGVTVMLLILPNVKKMEISNFMKVETVFLTQEVAIDLDEESPMTGVYDLKT